MEATDQNSFGDGPDDYNDLDGYILEYEAEDNEMLWQPYGPNPLYCGYVMEAQGLSGDEFSQSSESQVVKTKEEELPTCIQHGIIYTDGSCCRQKISSGYGIFMGLTHSLNKAVRLDEPHSSARAEVQAMIQALLSLYQSNHAQPNQAVKIYTDCLFAIFALHHKKAIKMGQKRPPFIGKYQKKFDEFMNIVTEELDVLLTLCQRFEWGVRINFIKSHSGEYGNERADLYATIGRVGKVGAGQRMKNYNDCQRATPPEMIRKLSSKNFFAAYPSQAEFNMAQLTLNLSDKKNRILFPRQQVVWDQASVISEEELTTMFD